MKYKIVWVVLFFFYSVGLAIASEKIDQIENLSQDEFKRLSENIRAAAAYKAVIPVEPLGIVSVFSVTLRQIPFSQARPAPTLEPEIPRIP